MIHFSDEKLYELACEQNQRAFEILYDRYADALYRFVYRFARNEQLCEEVIHEVFIELLEKRFQIRPETNLKSWIFTVTKNKGLNLAKRRTLEKLANQEQIQDISTVNIEAEFTTNQLFRKLQNLEQSLPKDLKETWDLRKAGHNYSEMSKILAIPVGTIKSRFHRLVEFLRKEFVHEQS